MGCLKQEDCKIISKPGAFLYGVCIFSLCTSGFSLQRPKTMHVRFISNSKLPLDVSELFVFCGPVMDL